MTDFKMCGLAMCGVLLCTVFKSIKNEYSLFVRLVISVAIMLFSFSLMIPILNYIEQITQNTIIYSYIPLLIKVLGIAIIVQLTVDIAQNTGEDAIATKIALFGKMQILILTMPLITDLFNLCKELLK